MDWWKIWCWTSYQLTLYTLYGRSSFRKLKQATFTKDEIFGLSIPTEMEDVPKTILNPIHAWNDPEAYRHQANDLKTF